MFSPLLLVSSLFLGTALAEPHAKPLRHRDVARRMKGDVDLHKRQNNHGRFTFYQIGQGACGQMSYEPEFIVALNSAQYGGGYPGPNCFKWITIEYNGKTADARIMDECPTCGWGDLDFSEALFNYFSTPDAGVIYGNWWFKDGSGGGGGGGGGGQPTTTTSEPPPPPTSTWQPPPPETTTTSTWQPPVQVTIQTPTTTTSDTWTPPPPTTSSTSTWSEPSSSSSSSAPESSSTSSEPPSSSAAPTSSVVDYSSGYNAGIAIPTGTVDPVDVGGVYQINQVAIGFGGLIAAGLQLAA